MPSVLRDDSVQADDLLSTSSVWSALIAASATPSSSMAAMCFSSSPRPNAARKILRHRPDVPDAGSLRRIAPLAHGQRCNFRENARIIDVFDRRLRRSIADARP